MNILSQTILSCFILLGVCTNLHGQDSLQKKDGIHVAYHPNGKIARKICYKDGKMIGVVQMFDTAGHLSEAGYWAMDRWVGDYKYYYSNGVVMYALNFGSNGKRTGIQTFNYSNGIIKQIGIYMEGWPDGAVYYFDSLGHFIKKTLAVVDTTKHEEAEFETKAKLPADSVIFDYVRNENLNIFRRQELQEARIAEKVNLEKIQAEQKMKFIYLAAFGVCGVLLIIALYAFVQLNRKKAKIELQNALIEQKNKEIIDSIKYARRIQTALITSEKYIARVLACLRR